MKIKSALLIVFFSSLGFGNNEPYLAEGKVQMALENALSRVIAKEQFLVQAHAEVTMKTEKKLVEGETLEEVEEPEIPFKTMPGFLPLPKDKSGKRPQERKVYRMIETPTLSSIRVHVNFDDSLPTAIVTRAKLMVHDYIESNFPTIGAATFSQMPMLKPPKEEVADKNKPKPDENADRKPASKPEKMEERIQKMLPWVLSFLTLLMLFIMALRSSSRAQSANRQSDGTATMPPMFPNLPFSAGSLKELFTGEPAARANPNADPQNIFVAKESAADSKKALINSFLARPESFRVYYRYISEAEQSELCGILRSPAFDKMMEGLNLSSPSIEQEEPSDAEEKVANHRKNFEDFTRAKDWQDRQFFGFLNQMTNESLIALANFESPIHVCVMMRYMKAEQNAAVLDAMAPERRFEVLNQVANIQSIPFAQILKIEGELRTIVQKMPKPLMGSQKDEVDFWGKVLLESRYQEQILENLERTHPEIYPKLAKYKFKLEDAAVLSEESVSRVLGEVDNEELCLALVTCEDKVIESLMASLPPNRRKVVERQMEGARQADDARKQTARAAISKKFREVLT